MATNPQNQNPPSNPTSGVFAEDFLSGQKIYPSSSNVAGAKYDAANESMKIGYQGKYGSKWYGYDNINASEATVFDVASSKGGWIWDELRKRGSRTAHQKSYYATGEPFDLPSTARQSPKEYDGASAGGSFDLPKLEDYPHFEQGGRLDVGAELTEKMREILGEHFGKGNYSEFKEGFTALHDDHRLEFSHRPSKKAMGIDFSIGGDYGSINDEMQSGSKDFASKLKAVVKSMKASGVGVYARGIEDDKATERGGRAEELGSRRQALYEKMLKKVGFKQDEDSPNYFYEKGGSVNYHDRDGELTSDFDPQENLLTGYVDPPRSPYELSGDDFEAPVESTRFNQMPNYIAEDARQSDIKTSIGGALGSGQRGYSTPITPELDDNFDIASALTDDDEIDIPESYFISEDLGVPNRGYAKGGSVSAKKLKDMLGGIPDSDNWPITALRDRLLNDPAMLKRLRQLLPKDTSVLSKGTEALVLRNEDTVYRLAQKYEKPGRSFSGRPNVPEMLQADKSTWLDDILLEELPFVPSLRNKRISSYFNQEAKDKVEGLKKGVEASGYTPTDMTDDNIGIKPDGSYTILDPGAIKKQFAKGGTVQQKRGSGGDDEPTLASEKDRVVPVKQSKEYEAIINSMIGGGTPSDNGVAQAFGDDPKIPILTTPGEKIIPAEAAERNKPLLDAIAPDPKHMADGGEVPRFATGGRATERGFANAAGNAVGSVTGSRAADSITTALLSEDAMAAAGGPLGLAVTVAAEGLTKFKDILQDTGKAVLKFAMDPAGAIGSATGQFAGPVGAFNPGTIDRFQLALDNLSAALGRIYQPIIEGARELANELNILYTAAVPDLTSAIEALMPPIKDFVRELATGIIVSIKDFAAFMKPIITELSPLGSVLGKTAGALLGVITPTLQLAGALLGVITPTLQLAGALVPFGITMADITSTVKDFAVEIIYATEKIKALADTVSGGSPRQSNGGGVAVNSIGTSAADSATFGLFSILRSASALMPGGRSRDDIRADLNRPSQTSGGEMTFVARQARQVDILAIGEQMRASSFSQGGGNPVVSAIEQLRAVQQRALEIQAQIADSNNRIARALER